MKRNALRLVQRSNEPAHFDAHHPLERSAVRRDDIDGDAAGAQRRRDFQPDEAGAGHDDVPGCRRALDDGAAVGERPQIPHAIVLRARDGQVHRVGAGREQ